jgi:hypothetical protein
LTQQQQEAQGFSYRALLPKNKVNLGKRLWRKENHLHQVYLLVPSISMIRIPTDL